MLQRADATALLLLSLATVAAAAPFATVTAAAPAAVPAGQAFPGCKGGTTVGCPGTANCSVHWIEQQIDHFNWAPPLGDVSHGTFRQRYFVHDKWWDRANNGPVFFYFGNEDDVELYGAEQHAALRAVTSCP